MQAEDKKQFGEMLSTVSGIYGKEVTQATVGIYWGALQEFDLVAVRQALDRHVKNPDTGQFMPKPADIIKMIGGSTADSASVAWHKVVHAIRRVGQYDDVVFDDPLIHRCVSDMGGWVRLCNGEEAELPFRAREFETMYRGYTLRREIPDYPRILVGHINATNTSKGFEPTPPVLIGRQDEAEKVLQLGSQSSAPPMRRATEHLQLESETP